MALKSTCSHCFDESDFLAGGDTEGPSNFFDSFDSFEAGGGGRGGSPSPFFESFNPLDGDMGGKGDPLWVTEGWEDEVASGFLESLWMCGSEGGTQRNLRSRVPGLTPL